MAHEVSKSKDTEIRKLLGEDDDVPRNTRLTPRAQNKWTLARVLPALASCTLYFIVGPMLIMINKRIIAELHFVFPMTLSGIGLLSSTVVTQTLRITGLVKFEKKLDLETYLRRIFPIGLMMALTLNFGNQCYLYMSVSLIQMLKAFTPAMTLALVWMAGLTHPSKALTCAVFVIALGTALASMGADAANWSVMGFLVMFLAEFFEAVKCMLMQYLLSEDLGLKFGVLEGLAWFAPTALSWMVFLICFTELKGLIQDDAILIVQDNWHLFASCFVLGFLVNIAGFLVIKTTSVVTLKILGQIRNCGLIALNVVFWHEIVTANQAFGYTVTMAGFAWYNYENLKPRLK